MLRSTKALPVDPRTRCCQRSGSAYVSFRLMKRKLCRSSNADCRSVFPHSCCKQSVLSATCASMWQSFSAASSSRCSSEAGITRQLDSLTLTKTMARQSRRQSRIVDSQWRLNTKKSIKIARSFGTRHLNPSTAMRCTFDRPVVLGDMPASLIPGSVGPLSLSPSRRARVERRSAMRRPEKLEDDALRRVSVRRCGWVAEATRLRRRRCHAQVP